MRRVTLEHDNTLTLVEILSAARPAWQRHANCRGLTEMFFPERGASLAPAREICSTCTVRAECADAGRGEAGVWGATSALERRQAAARNPLPCGLTSGA